MIKRFEANKARLRRHQRTRRHLEGSSSRPRLNVFRSGQHIYAQVIDDSSGLTLASASSLDASLHAFKPAEPSLTEKAGGILQSIADKAAEVVEAATDALPGRGKSAKTEKAQPKSNAQAKGGGQASKGGKAVAKVLLPAGQKRSSKTPVEALEAISNNRKVALAREVGKLVAERAKEKGVTQVVFDRGGYTYHGRVAALAEGAREVGLSF